MSIYVPLISALVGALIGATASVATVFIQAHFQNKRELVKEAVALALEDWKARLAILNQRGGAALPLAVFVQYHTKLIQLAERGQITPDSIRALNDEQEALIETIRQVNAIKPQA